MIWLSHQRARNNIIIYTTTRLEFCSTASCWTDNLLFLVPFLSLCGVMKCKLSYISYIRAASSSFFCLFGRSLSLSVRLSLTLSLCLLSVSVDAATFQSTRPWGRRMRSDHDEMCRTYTIIHDRSARQSVDDVIQCVLYTHSLWGI